MTPTNHNHPPLWRAMDAAYDNSTKPEGAEFWKNEHGYAAELRAIADWLESTYHGTPLMVRVGAEDIAKRLRWEADRAEAGEAEAGG